MITKIPVILLCLLIPTLVIAQPAPATRPAPASQPAGFIRFLDDGQGGGVLETAIASYRNPDGVVVHLVSAVHIAEADYYTELQKTFATYDSLLYEMVMPRGAEPPVPGHRPEGGGISISGMQRFLQENLELAYQLDLIDYRQKNFRHADLDWETFMELSEERGEGIARLMLRAVIADLMRSRDRTAPPPTIFDLMAALSAPDSARRLKLLLATQMQDIEATTAGLNGPNGSVILTERNKAALAVLDQTLKDPRQRTIGIFYGAAHMSDLEERLLARGFKKTGEEWRLAWDMREPAKMPAR